MLEQLKSVGESVQELTREYPEWHGLALLAGGALAATGMSVKAWRWLRPAATLTSDRVVANIDAPEGTKVELRIND